MKNSQSKNPNIESQSGAVNNTVELGLRLTRAFLAISDDAKRIELINFAEKLSAPSDVAT